MPEKIKMRRCSGRTFLCWGVVGLIVLFTSLGVAGEPSSKSVDLLPGRPAIGAKLFEISECKNCHSLHHQGSEVGPDLTQVGIRRSHEFLVDFIFDPEDQFPDTKMPRFPWKDKQQVADIVAFLMTMKTSVDGEGILSRAGSEIEAGQQLVEAYDCRACHIIHDGGRSRYPNLTHIGSKIYPEWEYVWLLDPQKIKRGTFMPTFGFSEQEASAIASYLESLK